MDYSVPDKRVVSEHSGLMCDCGASYTFTQYEDGTIRYELLYHDLMLEWRTVHSFFEFEEAANAFNEALHGPRH